MFEVGRVGPEVGLRHADGRFSRCDCGGLLQRVVNVEWGFREDSPEDWDYLYYTGSPDEGAFLREIVMCSRCSMACSLVDGDVPGLVAEVSALGLTKWYFVHYRQPRFEARMTARRKAHAAWFPQPWEEDPIGRLAA